MTNRYTISPEVSFREVGEEVFLLHRNNRSVYNLNETAALIWRGIKEGKNGETIIQELATGYDVDISEASRDVSVIIEQLIENNMIEPVERNDVE